MAICVRNGGEKVLNLDSIYNEYAQIAKHMWYREIDRRKRKGASQMVEEIVSDEQELHEKLSIKEDIIKVFKLVHVLDEVSKEVFFLRITGELSFREIGNIFEKNENWARVTFYRAKDSF